MRMYKKHIIRIEQLLDAVNLDHLRGLFYHDMAGFIIEVNEFLEMGSSDTTKYRQMLEIKYILKKYEIEQ